MAVYLYGKCNSGSQGSSQLSNHFRLQCIQNTKDNKMHDSNEGLVRLWRTKPWLYRGNPRASEVLKRAALKKPQARGWEESLLLPTATRTPATALELPSHLTQHPHTLRKQESIQHCGRNNMFFLLAPLGKFLQGPSPYWVIWVFLELEELAFRAWLKW